MEAERKPKKIFDHPNWEIYSPKRITWIGFLITWAVVLITIAVTMQIARMGA